MATNIKFWRQTKSKSKYNNKSQWYGGHRYDSKFEAKYAEELDWKIKAGEVKEWDRQVKIPLEINGHHICNYYIDFKVTHQDGSTEYVEVKGFETPVWQLKWKMFEVLLNEIDPGAILTIVK